MLLIRQEIIALLKALLRILEKRPFSCNGMQIYELSIKNIYSFRNSQQVRNTSPERVIPSILTV